MGKEKSITKKFKVPDVKALIFGTKSVETTVEGSQFPNGTQALVPVVDIRQGIIITEDRRYLKILEVLPTNFYLKSAMEQQNIIFYIRFLHIDTLFIHRLTHPHKIIKRLCVKIAYRHTFHT